MERASAFHAALVAFDPALSSGADCAAVVSKLATVEKACGTAKARAAARAADCGAHRSAGFADAPEWFAAQSGTSIQGARGALETARGLDSCPDTLESATVGDVSLDQAGEIVRTEAAAPGSEREL